MTDPRLRLAEVWGVHARYHDQMGALHETGVDTAVALLRALGIEATTEAQAEAHLAAGDAHLPWDVVCEAGTAPWLDIGDSPWVLTLEDGTEIEGLGGDNLPELPLGIHRLVARSSHGEQKVTLFSAPPRIPLPPRGWGMTVPLYALSERGIGTYEDLKPLVESLGAKGAGFLGMNPVHAGFPTHAAMFSPYSPSHRRRLNVLHLASDGGRDGRRVDYLRETPERMASLRRAYAKASENPEFEAFLAAEGRALETFALHQALSERHGALWRDWPEALHDPEGAAAAKARQEFKDDIRFYSWLQWRAETALFEVQQTAKAAGMTQGLYLDLAVGTHPYGAETWEDRGSFAFGASLGAPPDAFAADGQNWGLAPFNPIALRETAYAALAETFARQLRVSGMLRIDHILGFERTFWVPDEAPGAYISMPRDAMLAVARIEAARAGGIIIGEDLGNIPGGLREALAGSGVLGCRVAMFERWNWQDPEFKPAEAYDEAAIASFSTHDLPTWQGWRQGADISARQEAGGISQDQETHELAHRAREVAALDRLLPDESADSLHGFLARTPSRLVAVQAEVILGMVMQQNLPGTIEEYPNWRLRLPVNSEAMAGDARLERVAGIMREHDR